jgi:ubiquinone/menaquinone biosynthesis C-methylase UbiE
LIRLLGLRQGETAADVLCDGGVLTAAMAQAVSARGSVYAFDVDAEIAPSATTEVPPDAATVTTAVCDARRLPLSDGCIDAVGSLFTLGFGDAVALAAEGRRIARTAARAVFVTWDSNAPPAHEAVLDRALREAAGHSSAFLRQVLLTPQLDPAWSVRGLADVVRFDGFEHYWSAMLSDRRPLRFEIAGLPAAAAAAAREQCRRSLQRYASADGALRIPVHAVATAAAAGPS